MITYIKINGFKSFYNFEMEFTPLTVIAGVNASGKSNLFDALQLLARLAQTDLKTAFSEQRGDPSELFTQYGEDEYADEMEFIIEMLLNKNIQDNWGGESKLKYTRLQYHLKIKRVINDIGFDDLLIVYEHLENLKHSEDTWIKTYIPSKFVEFWRPKLPKKGGRRQIPYIFTENINDIPSIVVPQDGTQGSRKIFSAQKITQTILSSINSVEFPHIFAVKEEMKNWKFLQLNPDDLRQPTRQDIGLKDTITQSGKNLASALFRIKINDEYNLTEISRTLNNLLPNFTEVNVYDDKANKQFIIRIKGEDGREFSSKVLSEGTLRLLTLCILQNDDQHNGLLCFEEPENGIHPFRIQTMAQLLKDLTINFEDIDSEDINLPLRQVIVNTHSPVLVGELIQWEEDKNVSIWLSNLNSLITNIKNKKMKIKITKILPVAKEYKYQLSLFTDEERKLTLIEVKNYLETGDNENALKVIND
jgi:predicted ATPase